METMAVVQYNSGMPLSKVHYAGDLSWVQKKVLQFRQPDNRYNKTVISHQYEISDIVENYHSRECKNCANFFYIKKFKKILELRNPKFQQKLTLFLLVNKKKEERALIISMI